MGRDSLSVFVFYPGITIAAFATRFGGLLLFGPGLAGLSVTWQQLAVMLGAGFAVALGDLFFYLLLVYGVPLSVAMPGVFITKILLVAVFDMLFFGTQLHNVQLLGVLLGVLSIYCLTRYGSV